MDSCSCKFTFRTSVVSKKNLGNGLDQPCHYLKHRVSSTASPSTKGVNRFHVRINVDNFLLTVEAGRRQIILL